MAKEVRNANGHLASQADSEAKGSSTLSEAAGAVIGNILSAFNSSGPKVKIYDSSSESDCAAIVGIADGTYADTDAITYFQNGDTLSDAGASWTVGAEYYADPATGLPGLYSAIGSGEWTRRIGVATSGIAIELQFGDVFQKA